MKLKRLTAFFFIIALLCGCSAPAPAQRSFFAMDTIMTLTVYGDENTAALCEEYVFSLEQLLSAQLPESDTAKLNAAQGNEVELHGETVELLEAVVDFCHEADSFYDPTVYPIVKEWGFIDGNYNIPNEARIAELLEKVGYENISLNGNAVCLSDGVQLDFGACAKGYAADKLTEILKEKNVSSALLDLGGNIQAIGCKPDGTAWKIGVADPFSPSESVGTLAAVDCSIVTSGNYQRSFVDENGVRRCHIIDPHSGFPVDNGICSVTVVGKNGTRCDMLSTALFVMGTDKAVDFRRKNDDFEMLIITDGGELLISEGLVEKFTPSKKYSDVEVIRLEE